MRIRQRIGFLSDVHSNVYGQRAVQTFFREQGVTKQYCPGDTIGRGPHPNECCEIQRDNRIISVKGNHEATLPSMREKALAGHDPLQIPRPYPLFSDANRIAYWTARTLTEENYSYLCNLPDHVYDPESGLFVIHTYPSFDFIDSKDKARNVFNQLSGRIFITGHTHQTTVWGLRGTEIEQISYFGEYEIDIGQFERVIIDVGAVGLVPKKDRMAEGRANCAIFDPPNTFSFHQIKYAYYKTHNRMKELNFPT